MEGKDTLARINMHFGYLKTIINSAMPLQNGSKINTTMFIAAPYHLYMIESLMSEVLKSKDAELEQSDEEARESWSEADDWQLQFDELQKDYNKLSLKYAELENKYRSLADKNVDMSIAFAIIRIYDNAYKAFNNSYIESATSVGIIGNWNIRVTIDLKANNHSFSPFVVILREQEPSNQLRYPIELEYNATRKPLSEFNCDGIGVYCGIDDTTGMFHQVKSVVNQMNEAIKELKRYSGEI